MELKVWVEGVVRVVCGLTLNTSSQDVVIALAQAIGQTGRYQLSLRLRDSERQLVANDCPLQQLAQLGQLGTEVQFILRRTGPSLSGGQDPETTERCFPLPRPSEPEPLNRKGPQKSLTFNLGHSAFFKETKPDRTRASVNRASPEPRASPVSFTDKDYPSKEDVFRQILQQQRDLQDLELQLEALERETQVREQGRLSLVLNESRDIVQEVKELQRWQRENEEELMHSAHLEAELKAEMDREQDMHRRLEQIHSSVDGYSHKIEEHHSRSIHLEHDLQLIAYRQRSQEVTQQQEEALRPLRKELHHRIQQGEEMDTIQSDTQRALNATENMLQDRWEQVEELNKELRQCKLQQFIQQTGGPQTEQTNSLLASDVYLNNAGVVE